MNPQVLEAFREDGKRVRSLRTKALQTIHAKRPTRQRVELLGQGHVDGAPLCLRLILSWNRRTKRFGSFLTTLPSKGYPLHGIGRAYKWRWQGELRFKEWQSYANLHAFDTENPAIVEGLIWTAIAAAALKRFLAHMPQLLVEVPMSTRKVAMCALHVLGDSVRALQHGDGAGLYAALEAAITSLSCHAQRAHPKRDRQTGRAPLGLEPCFANEDVIEFAEAA
jgi:Transposase DDE domain